MLTVSMPTYNTPPGLLERAVGSVLAQTVDLRLVVVNDGGAPLDLAPDRRLTVFDLPENRGRYFADAVVLAAADGWFAVHDADDWCEPDHYERLIDAADDGAAIGPYWVHSHRGDRVCDPKPHLAGRFRHVGHWAAGVWSTERMRKVGGVHPGFRVGWDTVHLLLMLHTGPVAVTDTPTYHWHRRDGSLSTAPATGRRSDLRRRSARKLARLHERALDGDPAKVVRRDVGRLAEEVDVHAVRLRTTL